MSLDVNLDPGALDALLLGSDGARVLNDYGKRVRDLARTNASVISGDTGAITTESGADTVGPYTDVGYAKRHPGFHLWWHEVGNRNHPPTPHLRPALKPGI